MNENKARTFGKIEAREFSTGVQKGSREWCRSFQSGSPFHGNAAPLYLSVFPHLCGRQVIPPDCKMLQLFKVGKGSGGLAAAAFQMLGKARHDFHEIAWHVPVVELVFQDTVPGIAAGAGAARQREQIRAPGNATRGP